MLGPARGLKACVLLFLSHPSSRASGPRARPTRARSTHVIQQEARKLKRSIRAACVALDVGGRLPADDAGSGQTWSPSSVALVPSLLLSKMLLLR